MDEERPSDTHNPAVSVMCGIPFVANSVSKALSSRGFALDPRASIVVVVDAPRSYALHTLERLQDGERQAVVVTSNRCPEHMEDLLDLHPRALLSGDVLTMRDVADVLADVIRGVARGEQYHHTSVPRSRLNRRQRRILRYVAMGWNSGKIARELCIEDQSVRNALAHDIYPRLGVHDHVQAALYYWDVGRCGS